MTRIVDLGLKTMPFHDFSELPVWQEAARLTEQVYKMVTVFPKTELDSLSLQTKRATLSICSNIAEGYGRHHVADKIKFYVCARGSAFELKSHMHIAFKLKFLSAESLNIIDRQCINLAFELNKLIKGLTTPFS